MLTRVSSIVCIQLLCLFQVSRQGVWEKALFNDLLKDYNTLERPVRNESEPIRVTFALTLTQIIDVDERNQILVTRSWLSFAWTDDNLKWDPAQYGNISSVRIPPHRIWKPDVLMYNSADEGFDGTYKTNVVVQNNGRCAYHPPGIFKSTCDVDITWFPFDEQKCTMKFGSWTYDSAQLDLQLNSDDNGNREDYIENSEWSLKGVPAKRSVFYYPCCPDGYVDITIVIHIQRRTLYYIFNLMMPVVIMASMAVLGFILPPESGEKLTLSVTILLSMIVFTNTVAGSMPATSDTVPLLGVYFSCMMFVIAASVVSTILILNYHHRNGRTHEMSHLVRIVFLEWLPWFLRMSRPGRRIIPKEIAVTSNVRDLTHDDTRDNILQPSTHLSTPTGTETKQSCLKSPRELSLILEQIRLMSNKIRKGDEISESRNEWKFVAMVIDRVCLIFFTLFTIITTISILASAPQIFVP